MTLLVITYYPIVCNSIPSPKFCTDHYFQEEVIPKILVFTIFLGRCYLAVLKLLKWWCSFKILLKQHTFGQHIHLIHQCNKIRWPSFIYSLKAILTRYGTGRQAVAACKFSHHRCRLSLAEEQKVIWTLLWNTIFCKRWYFQIHFNHHGGKLSTSAPVSNYAD